MSFRELASLALRSRAHVLVGTLALLAALFAAIHRQTTPPWSRYQDDPQVRLITPTLTGEPELCLTCHEGIEQISDSHPTDVFGCVICHGGDRLSLDEEAAHETLIGSEAAPGNPSDLSVVEVSCGGTDCHSGDVANARDHIERITRNVHTTYAGAINRVLDDRELRPAGTYYGTVSVRDPDVQHPNAVAELLQFLPESFETPEVTRFASECLTCHIASQQASDTSEEGYYGGTGCASCHMLYTRSGLYQGGDPTIRHDEPGHVATHEMTVAIPYTTCNRCHNRGSYDVAALTFTPRDDLTGVDTLPAAERRIREMYAPGSTHFALCQYELDCIDCHTASEVMGDGDIFTSQADAQRIECRSCHGTIDEGPPTVTLEDPDDIAFRRARLNPFYDVFLGNTVLLGPDGEAMGHVRVENDLFSLVSKTSGAAYLIPQVRGSECEQQSDQQAASYCQECHTYVP